MRFTSIPTLIGASALLGVPLFLSCRDSTAPRLWTHYELQTIDGSPLPYETVNVLFADGTRTQQLILADTIQLLNSTDFRRAEAHAVLSPLFQTPEIVPFVTTGTYTQRADTLVMQWTINPPTVSGQGPQTATESLIVQRASLRTKRYVGPHCTDGTPQCSDTPLVDFVYTRTLRH